MCAASRVKVNPSSLILIHDCWSYAWDRFNSTKLRKLADDLDVINESQSEIYAAKTGKSHDEIRQMMKEETMVTGRKAVDLGLADEVIEDADDADIEVSEDHKTLYACGRKMRVAAMGQLPEGIRTHIDQVESSPDEGTLPTQGAEAEDGGDNTTPEASGKNEGEIEIGRVSCRERV